MSKSSSTAAASSPSPDDGVVKASAGGSDIESKQPLAPSNNISGGDGHKQGEVLVLLRRRSVRVGILLLGFAVSACLVLYKSAYPSEFLPTTFGFSSSSSPSVPPTGTSPASQANFEAELQRVLKNASTSDKTVILTTINEAWAKPHSLIDVFLGSFRSGNNTSRLLNHLVIISLDQNAHQRCLAIHPHCYFLHTEDINFSNEAKFMTPNYLEMMWRRIDFLGSVLELGYNFVFTDADIVWLRDPFPHFFPDEDFQIACDRYHGHPYDRKNDPNGGFTYVKSNPRTIKFYRFWYSSRKTYPGFHDQDVLNRIKHNPYLTKIRLQIRFLDTMYFGGFCEPRKDFNLVCTMHANCCLGLKNKLYDLNLVLEDWKSFLALNSREKASSPTSWRAPKKCR